MFAVSSHQRPLEERPRTKALSLSSCSGVRCAADPSDRYSRSAQVKKRKEMKENGEEDERDYGEKEEEKKRRAITGLHFPRTCLLLDTCRRVTPCTALCNHGSERVFSKDTTRLLSGCHVRYSPLSLCEFSLPSPTYLIHFLFVVAIAWSLAVLMWVALFISLLNVRQ